MIETYLYTLGSVGLVSIISLAGLSVLSLKEGFLHKIIFILVSIAVGALFGDALVHLIPEALDSGKSEVLISFFIILGIVMFFILEKFLRWKHIHDVDEDCVDELHAGKAVAEGATIKPVGTMVLVSDGVHNFIDGIIIAASYFISIETGIATTIAIILHEIPQEIGDFGVLLHAGYTKLRALFLNFLISLTSIFGALATLLIGSSVENIVPFIAAVAGGAFIYIAGSDLIPEIHKTSNVAHSLLQLLGILIGITMMFLLLFLEV